MRYSIAALSLVSPALALPHLSLLGGGLFSGHPFLGGGFSHDGDAAADVDGSFGGGQSYGSGSAYDSGSALSNGEVPASESVAGYASQGSYSSNSASSGGSTSIGSSVSSSNIVDAYQAGSSSPATSPPFPLTTAAYGATASYATSVTLVSETSSASTSSASPTTSGQTCDSPDIIGCETSSNSSATNVEADSVGIFDFVIVGGGTAGLAVAYRLSENTYTSVAVIEAGDLVFNNKNVSDVSGYGLSFGTEIDWQYESTAQTHAGGEAQILRAGKALGGTSTINGMAYLRAQAAQIDAWEQLGNMGWNWEMLMLYYQRSEHFQTPTNKQTCAGAAYDESVHGTEGPLKTGWNSGLLGENVTALVNATYASLGLPYNEDANGGDMRGFTRYPATVDRELNVREDAGRAYYLPIKNRTNLHLYTNSFVQRLTWDESTGDDKPRVSGVQFTDASGKNKTISAKKEVILSAGALRSPLLLELSGIGNPSILKKHGIDVKVNLPYVGENLQDQTTGMGSYTTNKNYSGTADYVGYLNAHDIFGNDTYALNCSIADSISSYASSIVNASNNVLNQTVTEKLFKIQHELIFNDQIPISEILISPGKQEMGFSYWGLLPFSRGNVHIGSNDATAPAVINPNYFMLDYDVKQQIGTAKAVRKMAGSDALCDVVTGETSPGLAGVPLNASDAEWEKSIKASYRSNYHYISTAAMMSEELGGVVDSNLLVYGVDNVRVIDASVIPFQVCGHLTATVYALAEKGADAIKKRYY